MSMDMNVDTAMFTRAMSRLKAHARAIDEITGAFLHNVRLAGDEYDTPTYHKALAAVEDMERSVRRLLNEELARADSALRKLDKCVNDYNDTGYRG